jgi:hypothetical protein
MQDTIKVVRDKDFCNSVETQFAELIKQQRALMQTIVDKCTQQGFHFPQSFVIPQTYQELVSWHTAMNKVLGNNDTPDLSENPFYNAWLTSEGRVGFVSRTLAAPSQHRLSEEVLPYVAGINQLYSLELVLKGWLRKNNFIQQDQTEYALGMIAGIARIETPGLYSLFQALRFMTLMESALIQEKALVVASTVRTQNSLSAQSSSALLDDFCARYLSQVSCYEMIGNMYKRSTPTALWVSYTPHYYLATAQKQLIAVLQKCS